MEAVFFQPSRKDTTGFCASQLQQHKTCNRCSQPLPEESKIRIYPDCQAAVEKELKEYYRPRK
ncbi:MAG: hypothetical protein QW390_02720 [Candidatus Bathyarchaeia archaeon]